MIAAKFGVKQHVAYDRLKDTKGITKYRQYKRLWWSIGEQQQ